MPQSGLAPGFLTNKTLPSVVLSALRRAAQRVERLIDDDRVSLEQEPDNAHDANAILVFGEDDYELGYVPRVEAALMALLLDSGAEAEAVIRLSEAEHRASHVSLCARV